MATRDYNLNSAVQTPSLPTATTPTGANDTVNKGYADSTYAPAPTTKGDLIGYDTAPVRIPIGADGQVLTADSTSSKGAAWKAPSGGSGQGGVNFLILDSAWGQTKSSNSDAEVSIGDWVAYADAAAATPVDMTGGTPATTIVRSTTAGDLLNGAASLVISKAASNKQGEGVSVTGYVPTAYRLSRCKIQFPWKVTSGSIASGDLKVFIYDVTNSQLITPFEVNGLVGGQGTYLGYFDPVSTTAQLRVGIHVASTSAVAFTMSIDDVKVGPNDVVRGLAGSNASLGTLTVGAVTTAPTYGTVALNRVAWCRVGQYAEIQYNFKQTSAGTAGSGTYLFPLPSGLVVDTSLTGTVNESGNAIVGFGELNTSANQYPLAPHVHDSTNLWCGYYRMSEGTNIVQTLDHSANALNSTVWEMSLTVRVPIVGWDANISIGDSSTFKISSYLANGTRVTGSAPTALGQYRSYLKNAGANTFTETNGTPAALPNSTDGIKLYGGNAYSAGDTANNPSSYDIFVGKNKNVQVVFYGAAGRTGYADATPSNISSTTSTGFSKSYDPTTGIVSFQPWYAQGTETTHGAASQGLGALLTSVYFDIIVSDNVLAVGVQSVRSEVFVTGFTGRGSTNTAIARLTTTQKNVGTGITYADSATLGGSFTVNEDGLYNVNLNSPSVSTPIQWWGISLNSSQLTTDIGAINASDRIATCKVATVAGVGNLGESCSVTLHLNAGDVIRVHMTPSTPTLDQDVTSFRITKVNV